jgi:hypothetical protein
MAKRIDVPSWDPPNRGAIKIGILTYGMHRQVPDFVSISMPRANASKVLSSWRSNLLI